MSASVWVCGSEIVSECEGDEESECEGACEWERVQVWVRVSECEQVW
jgi:hypothetical protein